MKKTIYALLSLLALAGCKKDSRTDIDTPKPSVSHPVAFNVNDFSINRNTLSVNSTNATNSLKDQISFLQYSVSDWQEPGHEWTTDLYRYQEHKSSEQNFGLIKDSLQNGRYHICFVGTDVLGSLEIATIPLSGGSNRTTPTYFLDYKLLSKNMFYAYLDTTVDGKPINKPITMERMVSQVTLHINDAIPANASKFVLTFTDYPPGIDLVSGSGLSRGRQDEHYGNARFEFPVKQENVGKKGMELCAIVFPYYYPEVSVDCLDKNGNIIAHKILPKTLYDSYTRLEQNTQYVFTGSLFGQSTNFGVSIDTNWNTPINVPFTLPGSTQRL